MAEPAIVILAGNEPHSDYSHVANRFKPAKEFVEADGDEVRVIFDGAGTQLIPGVSEAVEDAEGIVLSEHDGHPSVRSLVEYGMSLGHRRSVASVK